MAEDDQASNTGDPPYIEKVGSVITRPIVRSSMMSMITQWHYKYTKNKVIDLIQKHYHASQVFKAMEDMNNLCGLGEPQKHRNNANRTALSLYAHDLTSTMYDLINQKMYPEYVVPAEEIHKLPMETISETEVGLSVRMEKLEQAVQELVRKPVTFPGNGHGGHLGAALERGRSLSQRRVLNAARSSTPVRVVGQEGGTTAPTQDSALGTENQTTYAETVKRNRQDDEGFTLPGRVRRQKVAKGSSKVDLSEELGEAVSAPLLFYVGNTSLLSTKELVTKVLVKCAAGVGESLALEVLEVEEANTNFPNRRTKSWKVTVPYSMKALMENSNNYPVVWTHRRYFVERPSGNKRTKITNQADEILNELMGGGEEVAIGQEQQQLMHP